VSQPDAESTADEVAGDVERAPTTGLPAVDDALSRLADLDQRPVSEHHEPLAAAHEALHGELQSPPRDP